MTMGRMLEMLFKADQISKEDRTKLRRAIKVRNQAVHDLREPKKVEALGIYKDIADYIRRKMRSVEQMHGEDM